jgi:hypothetical protein
MSLVCAPAGYGKTSLVAGWLQGLSGARDDSGAFGIAWLSLDPADSDPRRFLTHLIAAVQGAVQSDQPVAAEAKAMLSSPEPQSFDSVVTALINDLSETRAQTVLVLEDYHLVDSTQLDDLVSFFLEHMPGSLHLVVTTRSDPALPMARLRVSGELTEIRARDLRFSIDEAAEFLNDLMESTYLVAVRFLLATSRFQEAARLSHRLIEAAEKGGRLSCLIEAQLLRSLALQGTGETDRALETLTEVLSRAEPCGFVRVFLDEGPPVARLLYQAVTRGLGTDYPRRLLTAFPHPPRRRGGAA